MASPPPGHPPVDIDWSRWDPPAEGEVRSPCPMLNALANHHILPHDGKNITADQCSKALEDAINLRFDLGKMFATWAVDTKEEEHPTTFDLDTLNRNGYIEHDVSLTRNDVTLGDNHSFDRGVWEDFLKGFGDATETNYELASRARYNRLVSCKKAHKETGTKMQYAMRDMLLSYGESALYLSLLGDPDNGKIPLQWLKILVEEERVPYKEGWRKIAQPFAQHDLNRVVTKLLMANEHKAAEISEVGLESVKAFPSQLASLTGTFWRNANCNVM